MAKHGVLLTIEVFGGPTGRGGFVSRCFCGGQTDPWPTPSEAERDLEDHVAAAKKAS